MDGPFPEGMAEEIKRFLESDGEPRGKDVYDGVFASPLFFPLQRKRETAAMMRTARAVQPKVVMEIGSDKGGGFYHWIKCQPTVTHAICCEVRGTPYRRAFEKAFPDVEILCLPSSSKDPSTVNAVRQWLVRRKLGIDCLFIDGDKCHFLGDFLSHLPMMNAKGIVFMHDVVDEPMRSAFLEASKGFRSGVIRDVSEVRERIAAGAIDVTAHDHWLTHWGETSCGVGVIHLGDGT